MSETLRAVDAMLTQALDVVRELRSDLERTRAELLATRAELALLQDRRVTTDSAYCDVFRVGDE